MADPPVRMRLGSNGPVHPECRIPQNERTIAIIPHFFHGRGANPPSRHASPAATINHQRNQTNVTTQPSRIPPRPGRYLHTVCSLSQPVSLVHTGLQKISQSLFSLTKKELLPRGTGGSTCVLCFLRQTPLVNLSHCAGPPARLSLRLRVCDCLGLECL